MIQLSKQISTDLLLHFECIARNGSLKLAADELNITASAISQSLKSLEDNLDATLCVRSRGGFSLTETGLRVFESTKRIKREVDKLSIDIFETSEDFSGLFSIGAIDHFSHPKYKIILSKLTKEFPNTHLAVQSIDPNEMLQWLKTGDLDIGFGIFHEKDPELTYIELGSEKMSYFAAKSHKLAKKKKLTRKDLHGERLTWFDSELRNRSDLKNQIFAYKKKFKMDLRAYTNNESSAIDILESGFAIVPMTTTNHSAKIKNLNVEVKVPLLTSYLVYNSNISPTPILTKILNLLSLNS